VLLFLLAVGFAFCAGGDLLGELGFPRARILFLSEKFAVVKPEENPVSGLLEVQSCYLPERFCVPGALLKVEGERALLLDRYGRLSELDLRSLRLREVKGSPAHALLEERVPVIHHGERVVRAEGIPKHWVYPEKRDVFPCGEGYWFRVSEWYALVDGRGRLVERGRGEAYCVMGKVVRPGEVEPTVFTQRRRVLRPVGRALLKGSFTVSALPDLLLLRRGYTLPESLKGAFEVVILDLNLRERARLRREGDPVLTVYDGRYLYLTLRREGRIYELIRVDPATGGAETLLSLKAEDDFRSYHFLPAGGGELLVVSPPYAVCLEPLWQGGCGRHRYFGGRVAPVAEGGEAGELRIPERSDVFYMSGAVVYCPEEGGCVLVDSSLSRRELPLRGLLHSSPVLDALLAEDPSGRCVLFSDGRTVKVPEGCSVRIHSGTLLCHTDPKRAELRDLRSGELLGLSVGFLYPEHVYRGVALLRTEGGFVLADGREGALLQRLEPECGGDLRTILYHRERIYLLSHDGERTCVEGYRLD